MKDPKCAFFTSIAVAVALGAGAMMLTIPHPDAGHIHRVEVQHAIHVGGSGDRVDAHRVTTHPRDTLTELAEWWGRGEGLPHLTGYNKKA